MSGGPGYSPERSSLRGIGSSMVVANHAAGPAIAVGGGAAVGASVSGYLTSEAHVVGGLGVAIFLALSIYLLMGSLDARPGDLRRYLGRRVRRIWPLYFATCAAVFVLVDPSPTRLVLNATFVAVFVQGAEFHTDTSGGFYLLWTLQVEEFAYLFFPLVARLGHDRRVSAGIGMVAFGLSFCAAAAADPGASWVLSQAYYTPYPWVTCYGAGLLAYERPEWFAPRYVAAPAVSLLALSWWSAPSEVGLELAAALPLLGALVSRPPAVLRSAALVAVGEVSYALYLTHDLFLRFFGLAGLPIAYLGAAGLEWPDRGRQIARRVRSALRASPAAPLPPEVAAPGAPPV